MTYCFYNFLCFFFHKDLFLWGGGDFTANVLIICKKRVDKLFKLIFHDKYFNANSIFLTLTIKKF